MKNCELENCKEVGIYFPVLFCRSSEWGLKNHVVLDIPICDTCKKFCTIEALGEEGWQAFLDLYMESHQPEPLRELTELGFTLIAVFEEL